MSKLLLVFFIFSISSIIADDNGCGDNEVLSLCGKMCEPTCTNPSPNPRFCPRIVCTPATEKCRCIDGYLRNNASNCVLPEDCP